MTSRISSFLPLLSTLFLLSAVGVAADKAEPAKPAPAPGAGAAADFTTPKGALKALYGAIGRGDAAGIEQAVEAPTGSHEKLRSMFAELVAARARLREAVAAKFGKEVVPADADVPSAADIDAAAEKIDGDRAAVELERASGDVIKVKGEWKSAVLADFDKKAADLMLPAQAAAQAQLAELKASAARVADGTVKTADEARQLLAKYPLPFSVRAEPAPEVPPGARRRP